MSGGSMQGGGQSQQKHEKRKEKEGKKGVTRCTSSVVGHPSVPPSVGGGGDLFSYICWKRLLLQLFLLSSFFFRDSTEKNGRENNVSPKKGEKEGERQRRATTTSHSCTIKQKGERRGTLQARRSAIEFHRSPNPACCPLQKEEVEEFIAWEGKGEGGMVESIFTCTKKHAFFFAFKVFAQVGFRRGHESFLFLRLVVPIPPSPSCHLGAFLLQMCKFVNRSLPPPNTPFHTPEGNTAAAKVHLCLSPPSSPGFYCLSYGKQSVRSFVRCSRRRDKKYGI